MIGSFKHRFTIAGILLMICSPMAAHAEVKLASPFSSHMVLQRDLPAPVWGWADAGETVKVEFAGQSKTTTTASDGKWRIDLDPLTASADGRAMTIGGSNTAKLIVLDDVLVGEVWLASGQSNMVFPMSKKQMSWAGVVNEEQEIAAANHPQIRMFTAEPIRSETPQTTVPGQWQVCTPENAPGFSAVGYYFARSLHRELKVPVGVVTLAYGASTAQAWIRREAIAADPKLKPELDRFDESIQKYTPPTSEELAKYEAAVEKAKAANARLPRRPKPHPAQDQHNPTVLYNGVIAPVVPFSARGIIWYQGESITNPRELFPVWNRTLINDWRSLWGRELPFYFCQLAALDAKSNSPEVRELQADALSVPNTGMAVTIDIGDRKDVHPHNKLDVGERLARIALARDYGKEIEYAGPRFVKAVVESDSIRVIFSHAAGLIGKDGPLKTFEIAGADGKYVPADASIDGDTVIVRAATVSAPVSVRYAWANYPEGANLYNSAGLPAAPFRAEPLKGP